MKLIQSFWSQTYKGSPLLHSYGWLSPKYNWISWILSSNLAARYHGEINLYTDDVGKKILIDQLGLPYSSVSLDLNNLNSIPKNFWAFSKVYTYSLQKEPFLHLDGDVFLWEDITQKFAGAPLVAQNLEVATSYYREKWKNIFPVLDYIPDSLSHLNNEQDYYACNMGITGGRNIEFFQHYIEKVKRTLNNNKRVWSKIEGLNFNIFFEQVIFHELAKEGGERIEYYFDTISQDNNYVGMGDFDMVPKKKSYLHLLGDYKRNVSICKAMETYVMMHFPQAYNRLIKVLAQEGQVFDVPALDPEVVCSYKKNFHEFLSGRKKFSTEKERFIARDFYNRELPLLFDQYVAVDQDMELISLFHLHHNNEVLEIPQYNESSTFYEMDLIDKILLEKIQENTISFNELYQELLKKVDDNSEGVESKLRQLYRNRLRNYIKIGLISMMPPQETCIITS